MVKRGFITVPGVLICSIIFGHPYVTPTALAQRESASRARQAGAPPAAQATLTVGEDFLNSFLDAMFTNLKSPAFPVSIAGKGAKRDATGAGASHAPPKQDGCASVIVLEREVGGVKTMVRFDQGRIIAPLAFSGSYSAGLLGCLRFQGWADTIINLEFDRARQVLSARVGVRDVHLSGVPLLAGGVVVGLVQDVIDQRINPIKILQAEQLSTRVPVATTGGALRLRAKEVRPEIVPGTLQLHVVYEFVPDR